MSFGLKTPLHCLPSVGEKRRHYLDRLGLVTVEDLLFFFPRRYHDLRNFKKISQLIPGETASVKGKVLVREEKKIHPRFGYLKVAVHDGSGVLFLTFFNQVYLKNVFLPEKEFFINGKVEFYRGEMQMVNPVYEEVRGTRHDWLLPVYPLTRGLTMTYLRRLVKLVLRNLQDYPGELLSLKKRQELNLANIRFALANIHFPRSDIELEKARDYLIFHEFFRLQLGLVFKKKTEQSRTRQTSEAAGVDAGVIEEFERLLPFTLTGGQKQVMAEVLQDLVGGKLVQRLVQGEVGCGKTTVAMFVLWLFARSGGQGVFLSPTEILAEQHFLNWQEFFLKQGIPVTLLVGELPGREKKNILEGLRDGRIKIAIGTHALLAEEVNFRALKVAVVDEQHKFGVKQREKLREKGEEVHYLVLSATPIPRSIALTFYGTMDFSILGGLPKGERRVSTYLVPAQEKEAVYQFIGEQLHQCCQGYLVTPAISGNEDIQSAVREFHYLSQRLPAERIGLIHGRLDRLEQENLLERFRRKELYLLVSTSVVESGLDVPEASFIIIDQAERFGLAQLHQLRGRVGRSGQTGYCFLVVYSQEKEVIERLENFLQVETGLEVAEMDLKIRGPGDVLGTRQHGILPLRIGNIVSDLKMLDLARQEAERIFREDPELKQPQHSAIRDYLTEMKIYGA
ncbi:MAG TPA: ATP-dependent DNA helicase RecG [bacterium]|nr:ATP-dependent DNA helicase RecG [bacterium]HOL66103.1 ATP-dependent DNA helicase RecG [bacterium]HPP11176.1 ATP-dependent DNA helicase RecG [bacterium]